MNAGFVLAEKEPGTTLHPRFFFTPYSEKWLCIVMDTLLLVNHLSRLVNNSPYFTLLQK